MMGEEAMDDLLARPEYFAERANADGSLRFYWKAPQRLAALIVGARDGQGAAYPWGKGIVRLADDRAAAEGQCRAITEEVRRYVAAAVNAPAEALGAPLSRQALRQIEGTIANVIAEYRKSPRYERLARASKKQYDWALGLIEDWGAHEQLAAVTFEDIQAAAARLKGNPRTQELVISLLAMLIDRSAGRRAAVGELVANPARIVLRDLDRPTPEGGWIWPRVAVKHFATAAELLGRPSIATAIILNEWLAQRTSDLLSMPRSAYREGVLHVVQSKTGQYVPLPLAFVAELKARLEWQFEQDKKGTVQAFRPATLLICETTHEPWKLDYFRHEFARIRAAVAGANDAEPGDLKALADGGLVPMPTFELDAVPRRLWRQMREWQGGAPSVPTKEMRFYHLRHTGITRLHQAGCDDEQIRSISGHTQPSTVYQHYLAVTVESARTAFAKRAEYEQKQRGGP